MAKNLTPRLPDPLPNWLLQELQQDLEDTAFDAGVSMRECGGCELAFARFQQASEDLRFALRLLRTSKK